MVLCLIALPVFAFLSIFSVKYRGLAKDALECLLKTATLRKCETGLDDRIRAGITGMLMRYSSRSAGFAYKYYKIFSWVILILFVWSVYATAGSVYNYAVYGNCNGPEDTGFCLLNPGSAHDSISTCDSNPGIDIHAQAEQPVVDKNGLIIGDKDAELTVILFGCYVCPYTIAAYPTVQKVIQHYDGRVNFELKTFLLSGHNLSYVTSVGAYCAWEQGKFEEYTDNVFSLQGISKEILVDSVEKAGLDIDAFKECIKSERYKARVEADSLMGVKAGVQGTPTFFVNNRVIVGPKPLKTFTAIINKELGI